MRIFIVRHGIAEESAKGGDRARELTEEGRKKMKEAAAGFAKLEPEIDQIFSSPLVRAAQTADIVAKALGENSVETMEELSPGYSPNHVLTKLATFKKHNSVLLAGHEPNCSELAEYLLGKAQLEFKKGAICLIEAEPLAPGNGILIWHLSPAALRLMK